MDELKVAPDLERIDEIIARYQNQKWPLIPVLQEIQEEFNYIPPETVQPILISIMSPG